MKVEADSRREEHLCALRRVLMQARRATRAQLAQATGLSTMTIGKLLFDMERRGEVCQDETLCRNGGRPSIVAVYNGDYAHFAAITVMQCHGVSTFDLCIYNLFGEAVMKKRMLTDQVAEDSFDSFFLEALSLGYRLRLAVFALPGEEENDRIFLCDFDRLLGTTFLPRIRRLFHVETIFENDVNAAVFGHSFDHAPGSVHAGAYFPRIYPPGAGLIVNGEILHGHRHCAGEIAAMYGSDNWLSLDYSDVQRTSEVISRLAAAFYCISAPSGMVLYGDFFTEELMREIAERASSRLCGRFDMCLCAQADMGEDMQRGAVRLGLRRMLELLRTM